MPSYIHIYTPPHSPEPDSTALAVPFYNTSSDSPSISWNKLLDYAKLTPWYNFMDSIRKSGIANSQISILSFPSITEKWTFTDCSGSVIAETRESITSRQASQIREWTYDASMASLVNSDTAISALYSNPCSFLPPTTDGSADINVNKMLDLSETSTQLEFIKAIVHLVSNNHDAERTISVVVALAKDRRNLSVLRSVLGEKLPILDAFSEKLLVAAARDRNLPLSKVLVERGVDVNLREATAPYNALAYAVIDGDENIVTYLLDHGADATKWNCWEGFTKYDSMLDFAVEYGNKNIATDLLKPRPNFKFGCPAITLRTLRLATLAGNCSIMQLLLHRKPALLNAMRSKPWVLYEAAATHESISTFTLLKDWGLDVKATGTFRRGSALAVACYNANMPLISHLLDSGVDVNAVVWGFDEEEEEIHEITPTHLEYRQLRHVARKSALQIAVENGNQTLVQLLLAKGADSERHCRIYPLQIAAFIGNNTIVKTLLDAGANVNHLLKSFKDCMNVYCMYTDNHRFPISNLPAIRLALESGSLSVVSTLVENGAKIPRGESEVAVRALNWNPLLSAMKGGSRRLVRYVIEKAGLHCWGTQGCFSECLRKFGSSFAEELINEGVFMQTALHDPGVLGDCVRLAGENLVKVLISGTRSALGELPPGYGAYGMALAVRQRNDSMIQNLLSAGVKPYEFTHCPMELGEEITSALQEAFVSCNLPVAKMLMKQCGEILHDMEQLLQNRGILTAYGRAIENGNREIVELILDTGLDLRQIDETTGFGPTDRESHSSLQYCLGSRAEDRSQKCEVAELLLDHGAVVNHPADGNKYRHQFRGDTPLQLAVSLNATTLVRKLLVMNADIHAEPGPYRGATALQFAAINGNFEILNILLEAGANINALPAAFQGRSAIEGASEWGRLDMVRYLLEAGADVKGKMNRNYRRSIVRAWKNGHRTLAKMIQDWKAEKFGPEDCEEIPVILESMTLSELEFVDSDAEERWYRWRESNRETGFV